MADFCVETKEKLDKIAELCADVPQHEALFVLLAADYESLNNMHCDSCRSGYLAEMAHNAAKTLMHQYMQQREMKNASRH